MLYKAIQGEPVATPVAERRDEPAPPEYRQRPPTSEKPEYSGPPTPCPAKVEYATPVFAKNYQGIWRYVVQIPYEGYFTQTIELTRCMQSRCHYLDGGCLSSPRWTSLLVAEIFYPETFLEENASGKLPGLREPVAGSPPPVQDYQNFQMYLQKRAGENEGRSANQQHHCDGMDERGCFQVSLQLYFVYLSFCSYQIFSVKDVMGKSQVNHRNSVIFSMMEGNIFSSVSMCQGK